MRLRPSLAINVIAALLTTYLFFTLSESAVRRRAPKAVPPDTSTVAPLIVSLPDSASKRDQPPPIVPPEVLPVEPSVIEHGLRNERIIALTFDACSTHQPSDYDEKITEALINTGTPATLFLGGKWMLEEPEQTRRLAANPLFELGNHTYLHPHLREASDERIRTELQSTQSIMDSLTGKHAVLFRPPYGEYDERVVRIAASLGLRTVQFDLASGDPDPAISKDRLIRYVSTMARNGSIVVMHINRRGWHTAEALPEIISRLRRRGFVFKTVSDLLHPSASTNPTIDHQGGE
jgi:peptidoglycan/xylan/chitin deacetylase (PgdA/CDA1 family)